MDKIGSFDIIAYVLIAGFLGLMAATAAADSLEEVRKKEQPYVVTALFIVITAFFAAIFKIAHPAIFAIVLVLLAVLQLLNQEGKKRRASWNILSIAFGAMLALCVVYRRGSGFRWTMLFWIIPILLPFIAGAVQTVRLNRKARPKGERITIDLADLRSNIFSWAVVVALVVTIVVLILI